MQKTCQIEGCDRKLLAKGLCSRHYDKAKYKNNPHKKLERAKRRYQLKKEEIKQYVKDRYKNNPNISEATKARSKLWYRDNLELVKAGNKKRYAADPEFHKAENNRRSKERFARNPLYKVMNRIRTKLRKYLKKLGAIKLDSSLIAIGCTYIELVSHLEASWAKNYPGRELIWNSNVHIDHIIPMWTAKTIEAIYELNHYSNLQLLTAKDNLEKNGKLPDWKKL